MIRPPPGPPEGRDDEAALVARASWGDREAFRRIVEAYQNKLYRAALGLLNDPDDAEDVVQEVFIRAYRGLHKFRGQARLSTWLYSVALNACRICSSASGV